MILVCPSCDAKFKVPDGAIPAEGRKVRCAKCKNSWHATPAQVIRKQAAPRPLVVPPNPAAQQAAPPPAPEPVPFDGQLDDQSAAEAAALRRSVRGTLMDDDGTTGTTPEPEMFDEGLGGDGGAIDEPSAPGDGFDEDASDSDDFGVKAALKARLGDDFPEEFEDDGTAPDGLDADGEYGDDEEYDDDDFLARRRADQRRQHERETVGRRRKLMTLGWGGLLVFWVLVLGVFVFQEENMRHYFPGASNFVYGLFEGTSDKERFRPEEGETLTPSPALAEVYVRALLESTTIETRSGQQGVMLRGYVENAGTTGANVPQVRAAILDRQGNEIDSWVFSPVGLIMRRGQKIHFEEFRTPAPAGAAGAAVEVIEGSKSANDPRQE